MGELMVEWIGLRANAFVESCVRRVEAGTVRCDCQRTGLRQRTREGKHAGEVNHFQAGSQRPFWAQDRALPDVFAACLQQ